MQKGDKSTKDKTMMAKYHSIIETFRVAIFDTIPDPLLVLNPDYTILTANDAFYMHFKVAPEDINDKEVFDIGNRQWDIPGLKKLLKKILPEKSIIEQYEVTHEFPAIGHRTILVNAREIKSSEFLPLDLILITFLDITDRKKWTDSILELNNHLQTANCNLDRYGHSLSHDLRVPVSTILGFSKLALEELEAKSYESVKEYIRRVIHNVENMDQMIVGLSQMAGIAGASFKKYYVSISDIAYKIIADLRTDDPERDVQVSIQQNLMDTVEPSMMLVALNNLLKNAWKFTRNKKPAIIKFGTTKIENKMTYFIEDNGVGFNMSLAGKLFGMFQRFHPESEFEGTGTGLAIVKSIIEKHDGKIWAKSEEGKGTTIFFTLVK